MFDDLFTNTTKGVDAVVRSREPFEASNEQGGGEETRPPVPDSLVEVVNDVDGVDLAQGNLLGYALVTGTDGEAIINQAPTFGLPWYPRNRSVNQSLELLEGRQARAPDEVTLDLKTFEDGDFKVGDTVRISFLTVPPQDFTLTGVFLFGGKKDGLAGATLAAFEPTAAQELMNREGQWDLVEARAESGVSETELRDRIRETLRDEGLNKDYESITGQELADEQADEIQENLSFFSTFLLIFALVALFVGAFVIYNTFSITIAQRIRELGLLRALGASGRQVDGLGARGVARRRRAVVGDRDHPRHRDREAARRVVRRVRNRSAERRVADPAAHDHRLVPRRHRRDAGVVARAGASRVADPADRGPAGPGVRRVVGPAPLHLGRRCARHRGVACSWGCSAEAQGATRRCSWASAALLRSSASRC